MIIIIIIIIIILFLYHQTGDFDQKSIIILSHYWKDVFYQTISWS